MRRSSRGASAIEFALSLPFLLLIAAAIVDGGTYLIEMNAVTNAAHSGARVGASTSEPYPATGALIVAAARQAVEASMTGAGFAPGDYQVEATWNQDSQGVSWIEVEVVAARRALFPGVSPFDRALQADFRTMTQEQ